MRVDDFEVESFAQTLRKLMKDRGVSAKLVSQATGIPTSTLSEWTAGRIPKFGKDIVKLSRFFGVSLEYLVTGQVPETKLLENLMDEGDGDGFMTLHRGVYRVRVEKFLGSSKKRQND